MAPFHHPRTWDDGVMPLAELPPCKQTRIALQVSGKRPPAKWLDLGLAQIVSRAWYEWYWARGIDPDKKRRTVPRLVREAVIERDGLVCRLCLLPVKRRDVHLDHVVPYSQGGRETVGNLRVTHSLCNIKRGAPV